MRARVIAVVGTLPLLCCDRTCSADSPRPILPSLHAPRARLRLDAIDASDGEGFLAFGAPPAGVSPSLNLSIRGDLTEAASNLFAMLRALDVSHDAIAVQTIPTTGLGEAINDRLRRGTLLSRESGV